MLKYRIYTEDMNNHEDVVELFADMVSHSFNVTRNAGYWNGNEEFSMIIEFITEESYYDVEENIRKFVREIKSMNKQDYVLVTKEKVEVL